MTVKCIPCGLLKANCYIVECENEALIIDPGYLEGEILKYIYNNGQKCKYILLTHRHFDHLNGAVALRKLCGAEIVIHKDDECGLYSDEDSLADVCRGFYGNVDPDSRADVLVSDGDVIKTDEFTVKIIHTPGHTVGGVSFDINGDVFCGDTIFKGTAGRTDFPGGKHSELLASISRLGEIFSDDTVLYPGHGEATTIGDERQYNPFFL